MSLVVDASVALKWFLSEEAFPSIVDVRLINDLPLVDGLRAEEGREKKKLRAVWPQRFAREAAGEATPEEQIGRDLAAAVAWAQVGRLRPEFRRCLNG